MHPFFLGWFLCLMGATLGHAQHLIAHRGASHDAPENTLAAFSLAWEQGADGVEGDFHLTADGHIVCLHDKDTERTAGEKLVVADSTLAELRRLEYGGWKGQRWRGEPIPTLGEVIATVPPGKLFFIEIKCGPEIVGPLADCLAESGLADEQLSIISFDRDVIAACRERLPGLATQWLTGWREEAGRWTPDAASVINTLRGCGADGLGCNAKPRVFDAEFVAALADAGYPRFGVWTVDDPPTARHYQRLGAAAITTNRPGWLRPQLDAARD
ncbi:glycerophosphodiester phosphodiesterase [Botrimarina sp.]|uniref:glycerophosphodiester phosphodiesterase n=1 Tax=Botrimarina sp. TaxID=2795802 RepID=UPI0032ECE3EB